MEQIEQLKKNNKDLKKALDKINGKYSKATQELTAAKLEIDNLTFEYKLLKGELCIVRNQARVIFAASILIGVAAGMLVMWGVGYVGL